MVRKLNKFFLLMWKNWRLQCHRKKQLVAYILWTIVLVALLILLKWSAKREYRDEVTYPPSCTVSGAISFGDKICNEDSETVDFLAVAVADYSKFSLIYSPRNKDLENAMNGFSGIFAEVIPLRNSKELVDYFQRKSAAEIYAGIEFDDSYGGVSDMSKIKNIKVSIRFPGELRSENSQNWKTALINPVDQEYGPRDYLQPSGATPSYYGEGFLGLQHLLTLFLIFAMSERAKVDKVADLLSKNKAPKISIRRYPHAAWYDDPFLDVLVDFVPLVVLLVYFFPCIHLVKSIAVEKENQLKEAMKVMGLPTWLHWTAWFVKSFIIFFVITFITVLGLRIKWCHGGTAGVLTYSHWSLIFVLLLFYICAVITFCFAISVFFSKANMSTFVAAILCLVTVVPYVVLKKKTSLTLKIFSCLLVNSAAGFGFREIIMHETGGGIRWRNLFTPNSYDSPLSLGVIFIMLFLDTFIYLFVALYVEAVFPGEYGVPKPWNFLCKRSYWREGSPDVTHPEGSTSNTNQGEFFEAEPRNLRTGVAIKDLGKTFKKKVAIQDLTLNMFEGQITVLLGHNGAGKTTTMSMLTGMIPPTSGTATINGHDIRTEMDEARSSLGLCPQHNIIFDELTVEEHLYFFSRLKGLKNEEIFEEIDKYVELLQLEDKRDVRASKLSGGMKRKLSVGMALCGSSKVVMLDEPSSGVDPTARRALWDLLLKEKKGRTILLTTHMMEEADILGDRIAILAEGKLQCCGSSFFLKKKYGAGYSLILEKSRNCDVAQVTQLLQRYIPDVKMQSNIGSELTYVLPENQSARFEPMLKDLEDNVTRLGVIGYGISLTTMEQVFLKVGAEHDVQSDASKPLVRNVTILTRPVYTSGAKLVCNQLMAMFMKKWMSSRRAWILLVIHLLIPAIFLLATLIPLKLAHSIAHLPPMTLDLSGFYKTVTMVEASTDMVYVDKYLDVLNDLSYNFERSSDIKGRMLSLSTTDPGKVRQRYICGASFAGTADSPQITAWFNNDPYHSPGISLGLVLNAIYRQMMKCSDCSIQFTNHPMPFSAKTRAERLDGMDDTEGGQIALTLMFAMMFTPALYIHFVVKENVCNSKHLQYVSGVKMLVFLLTATLYDMLTYLICVILIIITVVSFQQEGFSSAEEMGRLFVILIYFGWAVILLVYVLAYLFSVPASGYTTLVVTFLITGFVSMIVFEVLKSLGKKKIADIFHWIFLIFPHHSLSTGITEINKFYVYKKMCAECINGICNSSSPMYVTFCKGVNENYYRWKEPGIGRNLLFSFGLGLFLYLVLLCIEGKLFSRIIYCLTWVSFRNQPLDVVDEDPDVTKEKEKIKHTSEQELKQNYILVLRDLTKYYNKLVAVNSLCLGVQKSECFGLLGVNGAGKTTVFKMMTGDVRITHGDGWVKGFSMKKQMNQVQRYIGYCPQFDALLDDMTCKETIVMFALLRGIRYRDCASLAETLATQFDFLSHLDKTVKELSGGTKRKLSTAISIIGDPPLIYLDEPTTGMDPASRRHLWNALGRIRESGKCLILTSHSMEECEALCTRLAIMVNGNFQCLGSTQHLKNKFAQNYRMVIKLKKPAAGQVTETAPVENFVKKQFPGAILKEKHEEMLSYYITKVSMPWSQMFGILEKAKQADYKIEDYSLGQSSLEQVFLSFTKTQMQ